MRLKKFRQILKALGEDTRLRIINLLHKRELTVSQLCKVLNKTQPNISRHLARLRLTGIVIDRRKGLNVYYSLLEPSNKTFKQLLNSIATASRELEIFKNDLKKLKIKSK